MTSLRIVAIPTAIADAVRATGRAPRYGHPVHVETAKGYGPCRHCLRTFSIGEESRTLFTYDAFDGLDTVPLPGPVFIHTEPCARYPEDGGYPETLRPYPAVLAAYGPERRLIAEVRVDDASQGERAAELLELPGVAYVHVRDKSAGCYDLRIERGQNADPNDAEIAEIKC